MNHLAELGFRGHQGGVHLPWIPLMIVLVHLGSYEGS